MLGWRSRSAGRDDIAASVALVVAMGLGGFLSGLGIGWTVLLVVAGAGSGIALRHRLRPAVLDLSLIPPAAALLAEVATMPPSVDAVVLAAAMGVTLLVWAGAEPDGRVPVRRQFEPALIPALGAALAVAVLFFLPQGTGGQEGLAALAVAAALGMAAWLYLQSAAEASEPETEV